MPQYIKKAELVEAIQFTDSNHRAIKDLMDPSSYVDGSEKVLSLYPTYSDDEIVIRQGDYLVREQDGLVYSVKKYLFKQRYKKEK